MAARCHALLTDAGLDVATPPGQAALVAWRSEDPEGVVARALERGVVIRDIPKTGLVRASCGWWTNDDDLHRLVEAVAA
jgi:selenocysteine lyase/cysteine desulfurase